MLLIFASCPAYAAQKAAFSCEQIKESQVKLDCIEAMSGKKALPPTEVTSTSPPNAGANGINSSQSLLAARQALGALKKLNARVSTGISHRDYPAVLSDATFEVRQFTDSRDAQEMPEVTEALKRALQHYVFAQRLWDLKFAGTGRTWISSFDFIPEPDGLFSSIQRAKPTEFRSLVDALANTYPGITFEPKRPSSLKFAPLPSDYPQNGTVIYIEKGVAKIWAAASEDIDSINTLLR